jgi:hypothetical protein
VGSRTRRSQTRELYRASDPTSYVSSSSSFRKYIHRVLGFTSARSRWRPPRGCFRRLECRRLDPTGGRPAIYVEGPLQTRVAVELPGLSEAAFETAKRERIFARRFCEPLRDMERVAVEALPDLIKFLPEWRTLLANKPAGKRTGDWDTEEDRWLREVVQRLEGPAGLEKLRVRRGGLTLFERGARAWSMQATGRLH